MDDLKSLAHGSGALREAVAALAGRGGADDNGVSGGGGAPSVTHYVMPEVVPESITSGGSGGVGSSGGGASSSSLSSSLAAYEEAMVGLRNGVLALPRRGFGASEAGGGGGGGGGGGSGGNGKFTERDWLAAAERVWESMLYAPSLSEHHEQFGQTVFKGLEGNGKPEVYR